MDYIYEFFLNTNNIIYIALGGTIFVIVIWNIILSVQLGRISKKYKKIMRGSSIKNLESLLLEKIEKIDNAVDTVDAYRKLLDEQQNQLNKCIQKCEIIRYNAFKDTGSDLSFSIAFLDNINDGFILTGIYGRNESFTYAKPIERGVAKYQLSVEEEIVLTRCLKKL